MSNLAPSSCTCCGSCGCPVETDLPSTVAIELTITDCCNIERTVAFTASRDLNAPCAMCGPCGKYIYLPRSNETACGSTQLCNPELFDFGCFIGGSGNCNMGTMGIGYVTIATNGGLGVENPNACEIWTLSIQAAATYNSATSYFGESVAACQCEWGNCVASTNCHVIAAALCKDDGLTTPLGTYTHATCAGVSGGEGCPTDESEFCSNNIQAVVS